MCFVELQSASDHAPLGVLRGLLQVNGLLWPLLRVIWSLNNSESCACILSKKSVVLFVAAGLCHGCASLPIAFVIFMGRITRCG